ncbi:MAG: hypothetical protein ABI605_14145 [Rhizobacter sp.]
MTFLSFDKGGDSAAKKPATNQPDSVLEQTRCHMPKKKKNKPLLRCEIHPGTRLAGNTDSSPGLPGKSCRREFFQCIGAA